LSLFNEVVLTLSLIVACHCHCPCHCVLRLLLSPLPASPTLFHTLQSSDTRIYNIAEYIAVAEQQQQTKTPHTNCKHDDTHVHNNRCHLSFARADMCDDVGMDMRVDV